MSIVLRVLSVFIALQVAQAICAVGPVAAVQLWRLRESGRRAAIVCTAVGVLYYVVGSAMFRTPQASLAGLAIAILATSVPLIVLMSPWAKQACVAPSAAPSTPSA